MDSNDKWLFGSIAIFIVVLIFIAINSSNNSYQNNKIFEEKCKAAGGIPSKYNIMVGKVHHSERACLHPSSIINLE